MLLGFVTNGPLALVPNEFHPGFAAPSSSKTSNLKSFLHILWDRPPPKILSFSSHFRPEKTVSTFCQCPICLPPFNALRTLKKLLGNGADRKEDKFVPLNFLGVEEGLLVGGSVPLWWP